MLSSTVILFDEDRISCHAPRRLNCIAPEGDHKQRQPALQNDRFSKQSQKFYEEGAVPSGAFEFAEQKTLERGS